MGRRLATTLVLMATLQPAVVGHAQVTTEITPSGLGTSVTPNGNIVRITGGTRSGENLFHSFGQFNIGQGHVARFVNDTGLATRNLVGRVTGGERSNVFGTIETAMYPGANLFLINPAGWVFGPTASLNVAGSFHVSSADAIRFPDVGGQPASFHADPSRASILSSASPTAFGFLGPTVAPISIEGSTLRVPTGATLSIVGGDVRVARSGEIRSSLGAPGGRVQVVSVASRGEATLDPGGPLNLSSSIPRGTVEITASDISASDVSGAPGGAISIIAGRLVMDNSTAQVETGAMADGLQPGIRLWATDDLVLANSAVVGTAAFGSAAAGDVDVSGRNVIVRDGSVIFSRTFGLGRGGKITVAANGAIEISGRDLFSISSSIASEVFGDPGVGGGLFVSAPTLTLHDGGMIRTHISAAGRGGDVVVETGRLSLSGDAAIVSFASAFSDLVKGGSVRVTADSISLSGGPFTRIASSGSSEVEPPPGVFTAGDILLRARTITLDGGSQIQSGNLVEDAGNLTLEAGESVAITAGSRVSSQAFARLAGPVRVSTPLLRVDDAIIDTSTFGVGDAADVTLDVARLTLTNGGKIVSSGLSFSEGRGGNVRVTATDSIAISGASQTGLATTNFMPDPRSGLFSEAHPDATGPAGAIVLDTPLLVMGGGANASVSTSGTESASAGSLTVNAREMRLAGGARLDSGTTGAGRGGSLEVTAERITLGGQGTGFFSNAEGAGPGGNIALSGTDVRVHSGATLSATSSGTGNAGNVSLEIGNSLTLDGGVIATGATQADGGNISITTTSSLVHLQNGQITTSVQSGLGGGGNITLGSPSHPIKFIILQDSEIRADAFGGPGGNVQILGDVFLTDGSIVSASSALGVPGTISIQADVTDVSGGLAQLPESILQAASLLRAACTARLAGGQSSSLVVSGREGLPAEPGGSLSSSLVAEAPGLLLSLLDNADSGHSLPGVALWGPPVPCSR